MKGRLVVLGWGSLLWDPDGLPLAAAWARGAGPTLPLEFSRVSAKRGGALTLAIDPEAGAPCPTSVAPLSVGTVEAAVAALAARERCAPGAIGAACAQGGVRAARVPAAGAAVAAWVAATGAAAAVWTDLAPNFAEATGAPFSTAAALAHLRALPPAAQAEAARYVARAPAETDTPLRRRLAADPWWRDVTAGADGA